MKYKYDDLTNYIDSVSERGYEKFPKVVLVNTSDVLNGKVLNKDKIENKNLKGQFKKTFKKGDILFSEIRPINKRFANIDFNPDGYVASTKLMVLRKKSDEILRDYIYYFLTSDETLNYLQNQAESRSGTFPQITFKNIAELKIRVPDIYDQVRIVDILKNIDRKIEVNNKIVDNLEEQAQAIFKSWFVDFEPFQDGNFVESELGMIPEGWEVKKLKELFEFKKGRKPKVLHEKFEKNFIPYQVKGVIDGSENPKFTNEEKIVKIDELDTFMLMDGANSGNIYYGFKGALGSTFSLLETKDKKHDDILYWFLKTNDPIIKNQNTGSAIPHANKDFIYSMNIAVPYNCKNDKISKVLRDFRRKIIYNNEENKKLSEIRDALLPRLMSGEIDVSNIKIKGEEVKNE